MAGVALGLVGAGCRGGPGSGSETEAGSLSVAETLGGGAQEGFLRADTVRAFTFPVDHGPHPGFRNEWWYYTGNLTAENGDRFGYQLTLFRAELAPPDPASDPGPTAVSDPGAAEAGAGVTAAGPDAAESSWTTRVAWMGHLAVTSEADGDHRAEERFAREALGLAGAESGPMSVWIEDWRIEELPDSVSGADRPRGLGPVRLAASQGDIGIDLRLEAPTRIYLQGDGGLSQKGPEAGNASYYYSIPRMETSGTIRFGEREARVSGASWLDREWSTSALSPGVVGWDWFSLRLSDGWALMLYDLRREDGSVTEFSKGVLMGPSGESIGLDRNQVDLEVLGEWTSPVDGAVYPSGWRLRVAEHGVDLDIRPLLADQEMDLTFRYWEGAVTASGLGPGAAGGGGPAALEGATGPVTGAGYVELTGYAGVVPEAR
jgi:predicted secreted hydrolase